jgi:ABC-type polysaccharide/polyol phosphate transport system ATPase subunit
MVKGKGFCPLPFTLYPFPFTLLNIVVLIPADLLNVTVRYVDTSQRSVVNQMPLNLQNLAGGYTNVPIIQNINISLQTGEWLSLVGANGSG